MPMEQRTLPYPVVKAPRSNKLSCLSPLKSPLKSALKSPCKSPMKACSPRKILFSSPKKNLLVTPTLSLKEKIALARAKKQQALGGVDQLAKPLVQKTIPYPVIKTPRSSKLTCLSPHKSPIRSTFKSPSKSPVKRLTARNLFGSPTTSLKDKVALSCSQEQTPKSEKKVSLGSSFAKVKTELHHSIPTQLVGREKETKEIKSFLDEHIADAKAGSLYISGAPGTGKTALLTKITESYEKDARIKTVFVNCMSVKSAAGIYSKIHSSVRTFKGLQSVMQKSGPMVVVCLDEADQLDCKNQEVLYSLFELPAMEHSRLILIAVANSLDLTDRLLPRIRLHPQCQPRLMHFSPYSQGQLLDILKDRVKDSPTLEASALQLCARKVSAVAGDARRALDACRRALEMVETSPAPSLPGTQRQVTAVHMSSVLGAAHGQHQLGLQGQKTPVQQLVAACALSLQLKKDKAKRTDMSKVHAAYTSICRRHKLDACDFSHFLSLCQMLESRGVVSIKASKNARTAKICLEMDDEALERNLGNKALLSSVLQAGL